MHGSLVVRSSQRGLHTGTWPWHPELLQPTNTEMAAISGFATAEIPQKDTGCYWIHAGFPNSAWLTTLSFRMLSVSELSKETLCTYVSHLVVHHDSFTTGHRFPLGKGISQCRFLHLNTPKLPCRFSLKFWFLKQKATMVNDPAVSGLVGKHALWHILTLSKVEITLTASVFLTETASWCDWSAFCSVKTAITFEHVKAANSALEDADAVHQMCPLNTWVTVCNRVTRTCW